MYVDLDMVLVDFNHRFKEYSGGIHPKVYHEKYGEDSFWKLITDAGVNFWVGIPWLRDGKLLWRYVKKYDPKILSAPSRHESSFIGKRIWVKKHLMGVELILCPASEKQKYATPESILIDDNTQNIQEWKSSGGIGILHKSYDKTLKELKKLGL